MPPIEPDTPQVATYKSLKLTMNGFQDNRFVLVHVHDTASRQCVFQANIDSYRSSLNGQYTFPSVVPSTGSFHVSVWYDHDGNHSDASPTEKWGFDIGTVDKAEFVLNAGQGNDQRLTGNEQAGPIDFSVANVPAISAGNLPLIGALAEMRLVDATDGHLVGAYVRPSLSYNAPGNVIRGVFGCPSEGKPYKAQFWIDRVANNTYDSLNSNEQCQDVAIEKAVTTSKPASGQYLVNIDYATSTCDRIAFPR